MRCEGFPRLAFRYELDVPIIRRVVKLDVIVDEWGEDLDRPRDLLQRFGKQLPRDDASSHQGAFLVVAACENL
jgi:hypothetical protein